MLIFCHSEERNDEESAVGKADSSHFSALRACEKLGMTRLGRAHESKTACKELWSYPRIPEETELGLLKLLRIT